MELVIVPAQHDVICPICLDTPVVPRLTKCGHFFCWPCILRYAAATSSVAGSGNWRKCPICFESISTRQLKSVFFSQVEDYTSAGQRLADVGIPMVLLRGDPNTCIVQPMEDDEEQERSEKGNGQLDQSPILAPRRLSDLSLFDKISFVDRQFVRENVIEAEARELEDRLRMMSMDLGGAQRSTDIEGSKQQTMSDDHFDYTGAGEDEPDRVYLELAMTMVEDRLQALESNMDVDLTTVTSDNSTASPSSTCSSTSTHLPPPPLTSSASSQTTTKIYFHQAADGQPFFLHPLSIKMLKRHFGTYAELPRTLSSCPILEIEMAIMTEDIRKRHRYLHHLPLGCQFGLCEVDLTGIVSSNVLEEYTEELANRAANRRRKAHKEERLAAEANRRAQQRQSQWLETTVASLEGSRCGSPAAPGVAMGIFNSEEYYANFPLPGSEEVPPKGEGPTTTANSSSTGCPAMSTPRPIPPAALNSTNSTPTLPMAGSFASIAATSPQSDGFLVISSSTIGNRTGGNYNGSVISSNAFELSFDDLPVATAGTSTAAAALISSPSASSPAATVHHPHHYHHNSASPSLTSPLPTTANKKGKRVLLVSNAQRRSS